MNTLTPVARLLACALLALALCSAARPFDRLSADEPAYYGLGSLSAAGLLGDYVLPEEPLSRLEAAALVKRGLSAYAELLISGEAADSSVEEELSELSLEFEDELAQIGAVPA